MYGCNHSLSCLSGSVNRIGKGLNAEVYRIGKPPMGTVSKIGIGLKGNVSLVCSVGKAPYLRVNPDMVWLTPDMLSSGEFDISSNVVWNIV